MANNVIKYCSSYYFVFDGVFVEVKFKKLRA